jgi:uncharacterized membrane protein required for colicin V production
MRIKHFISTMFLFVIFAFIFSFGYFFFRQLFIRTNLEFANKMTGAFAGAFFAFLFVRYELSKMRGEIAGEKYRRL